MFESIFEMFIGVSSSGLFSSLQIFFWIIYVNLLTGSGSQMILYLNTYLTLLLLGRPYSLSPASILSAAAPLDRAADRLALDTTSG